MESDQRYFARRARQERQAADRAAAPSSREAHTALADAYFAKAEEIRKNSLPAA